jgi:hypothetical protein
MNACDPESEIAWFGMARISANFRIRRIEANLEKDKEEDLSNAQFIPRVFRKTSKPGWPLSRRRSGWK